MMTWNKRKKRKFWKKTMMMKDKISISRRNKRKDKRKKEEKKCRRMIKM